MTVAKVFGVSRSQLTIRLAVAQAPTGKPAVDQDPSHTGEVMLEEGQPVEGASAPPSTEADSTTEADAALVARVRDLIRDRATYGYRRVAAVFRREFRQGRGERVNHKRVYRVMRDHGLLLRRCYGDRPGRVHDGVIITLQSNQRWCSDAFEIRCWNGERIQVAFSLDCCDREVMGYVATPATINGELIRDLMLASVQKRFGDDTRRVPQPIQWLTDNGGAYISDETVSFAEELGLEPRTTPPYSPESNGMAESFVKSFKRDYAYQHEPRTAAVVLENLPQWIDDYNRVRPHKGLKMLSPLEYRQSAS
jgi:transposase InsO family protein